MISEALLQKARELPQVEPLGNPPEGGQLLDGLLPEELRRFEALFHHIGRLYHTAQAETQGFATTSPEGMVKTQEFWALREQFKWVKETYDLEVRDAYGMSGLPVKLVVCKGWEVYAVKPTEIEGAGEVLVSLLQTLGGQPPRSPGS